MASLRIGILSLSEFPDHELIWTHYADTHRGLVLCFDEQHTLFQPASLRK